MSEKCCFVGLRYIGLPTAVVLANAGVCVDGFDVNESLINKIVGRTLSHKEPSLLSELHVALDSGRLKVSTTLSSSDIYVIAVPTPFLEDHSCDFRYIDSAIRMISEKLKGGELIILESTSAPGTTRRIAQLVSKFRPDLSSGETVGVESKTVEFAYCPERILPGRALEELRSNDRVIGGLTPHAAKRAEALYATFCRGQLLPTTAETAEMVKLVENSYRDVNLAFANEVSMLSDSFGVDIRELISLANHHPRVNILQPSVGVGGHCIAVDPWFLVASNSSLSKLIATAREVNDSKPLWIIEKIVSSGFIETGHVALFGLSFKPNIDDLRESPALRIAENLAINNPAAKFYIVEPNIEELPQKLQQLKNVYFSSVEEVIELGCPVVVLVGHEDFRQLKDREIPEEMLQDYTGILHPEV